jgi:predicted membrane chloride channel (bestrophin family)
MPEANTAYFELRNHLNAWYTIRKKAEPFATAIAALNGVIADYSDVLAGCNAQANTPEPAATTEAAVV